MPPIPTIYDEEVTQLIESTQRRQKDIADFQIPRLRTCNGPLALQQRLFAELREDIDLFARELQSLELLVADQRSEKVRTELQATVSDCQEILARLRRDSRGALLTSKRLLDSQSKSNRDELLHSNVVVSEKKDVNEAITEDKLIKANNDVTDALRRTMNLMQDELERSVLTTQMLETSTTSLRSTSTTHDTLTNLMGTSKHLITALEKADWLDRLLILAALSFFILVVLFILKQRIIDRGLRVAFWWTRFLPGGGVQRVTEDGLGEAEKGLHVPLSSISITTSLVTAAVTSIITAVAPSLAPSVASASADSLTSTSSSLPEATVSATADHIEL